MLDTTQLNQTQLWGLMFLTQNANAEIERANATIDERNKYTPRDQPLLEPQPLWTVEAFANSQFAAFADNAYRQLIAYKEQMAIELFRAKTPEEQAAIVEQLQIPDVLKSA